MKKKFLKGFISLYSILCLIAVLMVLLNRDMSFSSLVQYIESSNLSRTLQLVRSYWGSMVYFIDNFDGWSSVLSIVGNGFMALISALYLPIQFIISILAYVWG